MLVIVLVWAAIFFPSDESCSKNDSAMLVLCKQAMLGCALLNGQLVFCFGISMMHSWKFLNAHVLMVKLTS